MTRYTVFIVLVGGLLACAERELPQRGEGIEILELVRSRTASLSDTAGPFFQNLRSMAPWKDSLAVVDMEGPVVIVLPWSLEGGREFGSSGQGPGELRRPQGVAVVGDTLVVFDRGNARLTWFDPDGEFLYSRQLMILGIFPSFHPRSGGVIVVPSGMPSHYALIDSAGAQVPILPRQEEGEPATDSPITSNLVVSTAEGFAVVDTENGRVVYEGSFGESISFSIPAELRAGIDQRLDSLRAQDPARERVLNPIFAAGEAPGGVLVWFTARGNPAGAVVDRAGAWRAITAREGLEELPANPFGVLLREQELFLLTSDGVRVFRVSG